MPPVHIVTTAEHGPVGTERVRTDRPYHLPVRSGWAGRTGRWLPLIELPVLGVLALVVSLLAIGASVGLAALAGVPVTDDGGIGDPLLDIATGFGGVAVLLVAVALTVRWVGGRRLGSVSGVAGRLRWGLVGRCALPAVVLLLAQLAVLVAMDPSWDPDLMPGLRTYAAVIGIALAIVPLQAAAEEYLTRGWLVQTLVVWTRSKWLAAVPASIVFVALHGTLDPWVVLDLAVFALAMCWLTFRTGGLEAAIVLHAVNNMGYLLAGSTQGLPDLDAAAPAATAGEALPSIAMVLIYTAWIGLRWAATPAAAQDGR